MGFPDHVERQMAESTAQLKAGPVVDRRCYTSNAVYDQEIENIFEQSWLFVAHESELAKAGDFRATDLAGQPVIAIKGDDGGIRVFFNTCRHRAAMVESEQQGCRDSFQCPYHHWEYDTRGRLAVVPRQEGFGPDFDKAKHGLSPVPRVEVFHGLVFASLNRDAPAFADYIGSAAPYLEEIATYEGGPQQSVGSYEYSYEGNWKLLYENTLDDYHAEYLHGGVYRNTPGFRYGGDYTKQRVGQAEAPKPAARAPETDGDASRSCSKLGLHSVLEWHDPPDKMFLQKERTHRVNIAIFPAFLGVYHPVLDMTGLRIIKPDGPDRTRVLTYCLVPAALEKAKQDAVAERFNAAWGPGGRIMMDDLRALKLVQQGLKAKQAGDVLITRGLHRAGPRGTVADEHSLRGFWDAWRHYMLGEARP
jgi:p-cumate 2,3-dioxygenase alpha subunit